MIQNYRLAYAADEISPYSDTLSVILESLDNGNEQIIIFLMIIFQTHLIQLLLSNIIFQKNLMLK